MPRKKKTAGSRQTDLKNIVRGSTGASFSIEALKYSLNIDEIRSLSSWLRRTHSLSPYFRHLLPRKPSRIGGLTLGSTQGVSEELLWALGILEAEQPSLKEYINCRRRLDSTFEDGDYEKAITQLKSIVKAAGWSHHALGTMCYLIGQTQGLEAQKDWIEEQVFSQTISPVVFFAYWLGVRTEPGAEAGVYENSLNTYIKGIGNAEEEIFLQHVLLGKAAPPDLEATLIRQLHNQSLVDLYEGLVVQAMAAASDFRGTSAIYFANFLPLMQEMGDSRALRIAAAMGDREAFEAIRADTDTWSPSQEINFARGLSIAPSQPAPERFSSLVRSIGNIGGNERELRASLGQHTYASLWTRLGQFSGTAHRLRLATTIEEALLQYRFRFLHDEGIDAFLFGVLHPALVSERLNEWPSRDNPENDVMFELGKALVDRDFFAIREKCTAIRQLGSFEDAELLRIEIITYLEEGSYLPLIKRLHPLISASDEVIPLLPYSKIADCFNDNVISELGKHPETAALLARIVPFTGEQTRSQLIFAIEEFLTTVGCDRASQLSADVFRSYPAAKDLVLLGCQMETLALSLNFADGKEMQEERILQLQILGSIDEDLKERCNSEVEKIVRSQEITNAIDKLKTGKIDCDEDKILGWARESLKGKFDRFRSFVDAGILPTTPGLAKELLVAIREGATSSPVFEVPSNEATAIVQEIVNELIAAYSFDPVYGLNSYLSLRVRHGTISGQLRRSWTEERLLTTADSNGQGYEFNEHWFEILRDKIAVDQAALVAEALAEFSREFDLAIAMLTDEKIQILSKTKPEGVVSTGFADVIKLSFYDEAVGLDDFEDFLGAFSSLFWSNLENTLEGTRKYLSTSFRDQLNELFDRVEQKISAITSATRTPPLSDAIVRARLSTNQSIDEMLEWFRGSRPVDSDPFPVQDLAQISLEIVKRLNPGFDPDLEISGETDFVAVSALFTFTDVFFVLFDNAQKHSGYLRPSISINVETDEDELLRIVVCSDCKDVSRARSDVAKANEMICSGEYTRGLSAEGGTGLAKLAKIVENSKSKRPLSVSVDEEASQFVVAMEFSFVNLGDKRAVGEIVE
ncbi:hypothetical protein J7382_06810 [Shimia sp. R11_0]|uniref:hypothetical protein n=1 Tax=Shimia sp. R11_0 TaxID=2821096 RepID=UPI001ADA257D|nr:hypothetical protein [Shimia sp. R11_0]MBO9477239.1 hypothetical protein [Shimia sp. R11_0]